MRKVMQDSGHGHPAAKTNEALEAIAPLRMTEYDLRRLAAACVNQAGVPVHVTEQIEQLLGLPLRRMMTRTCSPDALRLIPS